MYKITCIKNKKVKKLEKKEKDGGDTWARSVLSFAGLETGERTREWNWVRARFVVKSVISPGAHVGRTEGSMQTVKI